MNKTILYLLIIFVEVLFCSPLSQGKLFVGDPCVYKSMPGVCKRENDCPKLKEDFEKNRIGNNDVISCGLDIRSEIICCPLELSKPRSLQRPSEIYCKLIEANSSMVLIPHVFGGEAVPPGIYGHMVAIGTESRRKSDPYEYICGGTLITAKFVLTAAHCVIKPTQKPVVVLLGVVNLNDAQQNGELIRIKKTYPHDDYMSRQFYNDIAVIELESEVAFTANIYPTCLNTNNTLPLPDVELYVSGWGKTEFKAHSNELLDAKLNLTSLDECNATYAEFDVNHQLKNGIVDTQICAIGKGKDSCRGDSGSPLIIKKNADYGQYRVVGVVAFGNGCGGVLPGTYTRVSSFIDFIEEIVWPNFFQ